MRLTRVLVMLLAILIISAGCDRSSKSDIEGAHQLANIGECVVTHTSNGTSTRSMGSMAVCDLELFVSRRGGPQDEFEMCINKDNPQYTEYSSLREGDRIKFEYAEAPTQSIGNRSTHVSFNRLYR